MSISSVRSFIPSPCPREDIRQFLETWHYSGSINGVNISHCFRLDTPAGDLIGAAIVGPPASPQVYRKYSERSKWHLTEIRRLACVDDTPKNTESYFIGWICRWIKKNTPYHRVLAFSDGRVGHVGTIYKASNFKLWGETRSRIVRYGQKEYHPRVLNKDKPYAREVQRAYAAGEAELVNAGTMYAYTRDLVRKPVVRAGRSRHQRPQTAGSEQR